MQGFVDEDRRGQGEPERGGRREMPFNLSRIGPLLRETREKRGITFDEASNALFIRKRVIGAIEAGDWDNLPHAVYVKGYVRQYAIFLEMPDLLENEATSTENESPVEGPEGVNKKRDGILRRWKFRKRGAQAIRPVSAPWSVIEQL
jgi:cytoskeleton protein RodZ